MGSRVVDLSDLSVCVVDGMTTMYIDGKTIVVKKGVSINMELMELAELVLKTGTEDTKIVIGQTEADFLRTMSNLRKIRKRKLELIKTGEKPCWSSRHSWHPSDDNIERCLRLKGECSGSCPNLGWGDPLCFGYLDVNPYMSGNHLTGNISHINPITENGEGYNYRINTDDGVKMTIHSSQEFTDKELQLATCEVRKMILDPLKEEDIILKSKKLDYKTPLPSSASAIRQMQQFGDYLGIDKALDNRLYQQVIIKEWLPGIPPPNPMQLLQKYPRGGVTDLFDHEFSPTIREPWMENCHLDISDEYDYSPAEKLCAKVTPMVRYPDLSSLKSDGYLAGERFGITFDSDSGTVGSVVPKSDKYTVDSRMQKISIGKERLITNLVTKEKKGIKKKYTIDSKRRIFIEKKHGMMVPILYSILLVSCMISPLESSYICGDDKHGTLWTLPSTEDCSVDGDAGGKLVADVYQKEYDYNLTMHRCYKTIRIDKTTYGFFGPKSYLGSVTSQHNINIEDCNSAIALKKIDNEKLTRIGEYRWSTNHKPDIEYEWCCKEVLTYTTNYYLEEVNARVHLINGFAVIVSADADVSHCSYKDGNYSSATSTYIWKPIDALCNIKKIGTGEFIKLNDGHIISYDLQLSLMASGEEEYCGVRYMSTEQGLLLKTDSRGRRDVDAGEKNFLLQAANKYSKSLYNNNYLSICTIDRMLNTYMSDMARANPSRFARSYFNKKNLAAKFVGEALLVWECIPVEIVKEMRGHKYAGICYDMMPVIYEYNRKELIGYLDKTTDEVIPVSSTHDCNSVSGYLIYDGEWRRYTNDTNYDVVVAIQRIPSNTAHMPIKEVSFVNNHLHSVYGPSGSRYRESLVNDFVALGAKHFVNDDVECNESLDSRIMGMVKDAKEGLRNVIFYPLKMGVLLILSTILLYMVIKFGWHISVRNRIKQGYQRVRYLRNRDDVVIET